MEGVLTNTIPYYTCVLPHWAFIVSFSCSTWTCFHSAVPSLASSPKAAPASYLGSVVHGRHRCARRVAVACVVSKSCAALLPRLRRLRTPPPRSVASSYLGSVLHGRRRGCGSCLRRIRGLPSSNPPPAYVRSVAAANTAFAMDAASVDSSSVRPLPPFLLPLLGLASRLVFPVLPASLLPCYLTALFFWFLRFAHLPRL
jgi:hypothetical protein